VSFFQQKFMSKGTKVERFSRKRKQRDSMNEIIGFFTCHSAKYPQNFNNVLTSVVETLFKHTKLNNYFFKNVKVFNFQCIDYTNFHKKLSFKILN